MVCLIQKIEHQIVRRCVLLSRSASLRSRTELSAILFFNIYPGASNLAESVSMQPGGGVLQNFLGGDVPLEPWNPQSIPELVHVNFATLYETKLPKSPLSQSSCFPETTEVTSTVQPKQNRFDFFYILDCQFPVSLVQTKIISQLISLNGK